MNKEPQWITGPPENPSGAYAFIYKNGKSAVVWEATSCNANQIIYHLKIPDQPKMNFNPRVFKEPDYGMWIGEYSST